MGFVIFFCIAIDIMYKMHNYLKNIIFFYKIFVEIGLLQNNTSSILNILKIFFKTIMQVKLTTMCF